MVETLPKTIQPQITQGNNDKMREVRRNDKGQERGTRHLSYQELMDRRAKGLCFKCE